jgi:hypothetical protein
MATPGLPSFHGMGIFFQLMYPLYTGRPGAMFRPTYPRAPPVTSPGTVLEALEAVKPNYVFVVPSLLEAWVHDPHAVNFLKSLDMIVSICPPIFLSFLPTKIRVTVAVRSLSLLATVSSHRAASSGLFTGAPNSGRLRG